MGHLLGTRALGTLLAGASEQWCVAAYMIKPRLCLRATASDSIFGALGPIRHRQGSPAAWRLGGQMCLDKEVISTHRSCCEALCTQEAHGLASLFCF